MIYVMVILILLLFTCNNYSLYSSVDMYKLKQTHLQIHRKFESN